MKRNTIAETIAGQAKGCWSSIKYKHKKHCKKISTLCHIPTSILMSAFCIIFSALMMLTYTSIKDEYHYSTNIESLKKIKDFDNSTLYERKYAGKDSYRYPMYTVIDSIGNMLIVHADTAQYQKIQPNLYKTAKGRIVDDYNSLQYYMNKDVFKSPLEYIVANTPRGIAYIEE